MIHDLRFTIRALMKRPSFAAGTVLVLGLAVGVDTAVFSLINALLLRPLPVPEPDRLVFVYRTNDRMTFPYSYYQQLQQKAGDLLTELSARSGDVGRLRVGNEVIPLQGEAVTGHYFDALGVAPRLGRALSPSDDASASPPVAVISDALWKAHYAAAPDVIGRTLRIDSGALFVGRYATWRDYTIVGVMPASFTGTGNPWQPAQYWAPLAQRADHYRAARGLAASLADFPVVPIGRLKPSISLTQARAAVDAAGRDILQAGSEHLTKDETFALVTSRRVRLPFSGAYYMDVPRILATLAAVGTLLLVIAGANLAGMLLARGVSRQTEIAIRLSLGVGRLRLVRQLLGESLLVAVAGGCAGLLLGRVLVAAALRDLPSQLPGSSGTAVLIDVPVDARVIAFAFLSGIVTAAIVGLFPAIQALRVDLLQSLGGTAATPRMTRSKLRRLVLIPQIALALVLLLVTGVFVRTLLRIELAHPGYESRQVVALDIQLPQRPLDTAEQRRQEQEAARTLQKRVVGRLAALPGVSSAAIVNAPADGVPLAASTTTIIARSDYETTRQYRGATEGTVSADYFATLGIRLLRGRTFDERDRVADSRSVIVSERLANEIWPVADPIGQQIAMHEPKSPYPVQWLDVVGVVASVTRPLDEYPRPVFYVPIEARPLIGTTFLLRGEGNPAALVATAKQAIAAVDPAIVVSRAQPLEETIGDVRFPRRFSAGLLGASGFAALLLAAIGVFALMSYAVAQRTAEIGVRMVLGAGRRQIVRLIVRDGAALALAGIALGFALAFAALRYASHAIVPLPEMDAATFVVVPALLATVVVLACYLPAQRAARVDPLAVLRRS